VDLHASPLGPTLTGDGHLDKDVERPRASSSNLLSRRASVSNPAEKKPTRIPVSVMLANGHEVTVHVLPTASVTECKCMSAVGNTEGTNAGY